MGAMLRGAGEAEATLGEDWMPLIFMRKCSSGRAPGPADRAPPPAAATALARFPAGSIARDPTELFPETLLTTGWPTAAAAGNVEEHRLATRPTGAPLAILATPAPPDKLFPTEDPAVEGAVTVLMTGFMPTELDE